MVIVEASLDSKSGHHLDKAHSWISALKRRHINSKIFTYSIGNASKFLGDDVEIRTIASRYLLFSSSLPEALRVYLSQILTIRGALQESKNIGDPVLILTVRNGVVLFLSLFGFRPVKPIGIIVMNDLISDGRYSVIRALNAAGLALAVKKGCFLFCNSLSLEKLVKERLHLRDTHKVQTVPDPVELDSNDPTFSIFTSESPLFVSGLDDHRRNTIAVLSSSIIEGRHPLTVHAPGTNNSLSQQRSDDFLLSGLQDRFAVTLLNSYYTASDLNSLIARHRATILCYSNSFMSASGIAAFSLVNGVPLITNRFPFIRELEERFGLIGEFFEPDDIRGVQDALTKLSRWSPSQIAKFQSAISLARHYFNAYNCSESPISLLIGKEVKLK